MKNLSSLCSLKRQALHDPLLILVDYIPKLKIGRPRVPLVNHPFLTLANLLLKCHSAQDSPISPISFPLYRSRPFTSPCCSIKHNIRILRITVEIRKAHDLGVVLPVLGRDMHVGTEYVFGNE
jgi:hypothetical protein